MDAEDEDYYNFLLSECTLPLKETPLLYNFQVGLFHVFVHSHNTVISYTLNLVDISMSICTNSWKLFLEM